ncbi:MAG: aminotransferase class I/II-fold pyridoxal phosphate-dependent enzyme, partial [Anaerolineales bacterium]
SKAYNMAGWRLGMAAGNPEVVGYIKNYKSQVDTSHFEPILAGGIAAMTGDQKWINDRNAIYQKRRDTVLAGLEEVGFEALSPKAAIYIWTRVPKGFEDYEFCARLLRDTGISTTPGAVYGEHGTGYFRISLCTPRERIEEAMARMVDWVRVEI